MNTPSSFDRAAEFIWTHARVLERRMFMSRFLGDDKSAVLEALRAFRNQDGGFGQALEPDLRASESQPIHAEFALQIMRDFGLRDKETAEGVCEYLGSIANDEGLVSAILPSAQQYPRAVHWDGPSPLEPDLGATIGVVGLLHFQEVSHGWLEKATASCSRLLSTTVIEDAHRIKSALTFLQYAPAAKNVAALRDALRTQLDSARWFTTEVPVTTYAMTPLDFATSPAEDGSSFFSAETISTHLDDLARQQEDDGGWPIYWDPPGAGPRCEWRAIWTLNAITVLNNYGRVQATS